VTTLQEAAICPICKVSMELTKVGRNHDRRSGDTDTYQAICKNENCRWYDTGRVISAYDDGTVYERKIGKERDFPTKSPDAEALGRRSVEDAVGRDLRDELG
jgi:hypothetical protein